MSIQFVYPAYTTMLGHLRFRALEGFKTRLEQLLAKGEGFAAAVRSCTEACMLEFDHGCSGNASVNVENNLEISHHQFSFIICGTHCTYV